MTVKTRVLLWVIFKYILELFLVIELKLYEELSIAELQLHLSYTKAKLLLICVW